MYRKAILTIVIAVFGLVNSYSAEIIDGENFIDPTKPLFYVETTNDGVVDEIFRTVVPPSYDISFIRAGNEDTSVAVINSVRVKIGDIVGGAEVLQIDREGVILLIDNEEQRINMYANSIKSTQ